MSKPGFRKRRRFVQFSLRTFLIFLTVAGIIVFVSANRANKQKALVVWVQKNGGQVEYRPRWFLQFMVREPVDIDANFVDYAFWVSKVDVRLKSDSILPLATAYGLEELSLSSSSVSDISVLAGATDLRELDLLNTRVEDISSLAKITKLRKLDLSGTLVKDLAPLTELTQLTELRLSYSTVSELAPLKNLHSLHTLFLDGTSVSDLSSLTGLQSLRCLRIGRTNVTEAEYEYLQEKLPYCHIVFYR